jgi:prepilin signal peptidase PulO-like enzyme (type II secretory pathway)
LALIAAVVFGLVAVPGAADAAAAGQQASQAAQSFDRFWGDLAVDLAAIVLLAYAIYYRRHHRHDLLTAFVCFNLALFAVVKVLSAGSATIGLALGLGLMGALSIIRLRSQELSYAEVAYFFSALALALVNGVGPSPPLYAATLNAVVLAGMFAMDRLEPRGRVRRVALVLDQIYTDEAILRAELRRRTGAEVVAVSVEEIDYVRDVMRLEVHLAPAVAGAAAAEEPLLPRLVPLAAGEPIGHERRNGR